MSGTHKSESLFLEGPAGKLEAILWSPVGETTPPFAAVVCHPHPMFGGTMHNKVVYNAAKAIDALGAPVLRLNFRGAGLSVGSHDAGKGEQEDVRTAIDFLAGRYPGLPIVLAGFSFGCWVGLRVGCADARVIDLIGLGTPINSSDFSYLESCAKPKLFVQGQKDEFGDAEKLRQFVASLPGENHFVVVPHAEHFFKGKHDRMAEELTRWLGRRYPRAELER